MKNMSYIKYKEINFEPQQQALSPTGIEKKRKKKFLENFWTIIILHKKLINFGCCRTNKETTNYNN